MPRIRSWTDDNGVKWGVHQHRPAGAASADVGRTFKIRDPGFKHERVKTPRWLDLSIAGIVLAIAAALVTLFV